MNICLNKLLEGRFKLGLEAKLLLHLLQFTHATKYLQTIIVLGTRKQKRQKINDLIRQDEEGVLVYSKQTVYGFHLRTNGYGLFFEKGKMKTQRNASIYSIEFNEIKHQSYKNGIKSITKKIKAWINLQKKPLKNKEFYNQ